MKDIPALSMSPLKQMMSMLTNTDQQQLQKLTCEMNTQIKLNLLAQRRFQALNGIFTELLLMMMVKQSSTSMQVIQVTKMHWPEME